MAAKRLQTEAEVDEAVDALLTSLGVPDDGSSPTQTGFEAADAQPTFAEGEKAGVAPSASVGDLWGAPKPKKK